jgi:hypothetical protein
LPTVSSLARSRENSRSDPFLESSEAIIFLSVSRLTMLSFNRASAREAEPDERCQHLPIGQQDRTVTCSYV